MKIVKGLLGIGWIGFLFCWAGNIEMRESMMLNSVEEVVLALFAVAVAIIITGIVWIKYN